MDSQWIEVYVVVHYKPAIGCDRLIMKIAPRYGLPLDRPSQAFMQQKMSLVSGLFTWNP